MPKFLEDKLKKEYGAKNSIPYKVMNSIGAMKGNKETSKGADMEKKHNEDIAGKAAGNMMKMKASKKKPFPPKK